MTVLCELLNIPLSTFYYPRKENVADTAADNAIISMFHDDRSNEFINIVIEQLLEGFDIQCSNL